MSLHQVRLRAQPLASKAIDGRAIADFLDGKTDLKAALNLDDAFVEQLRGQARALHGTSQWQRVIDVVMGVVELGGARVEDVVLLLEAYRALGNQEAVHRCELVLDGLLQRLEQEVRGATANP